MKDKFNWYEWSAPLVYGLIGFPFALWFDSRVVYALWLYSALFQWGLAIIFKNKIIDLWKKE